MIYEKVIVEFFHMQNFLKSGSGVNTNFSQLDSNFIIGRVVVSVGAVGAVAHKVF